MKASELFEELERFCQSISDLNKDNKRMTFSYESVKGNKLFKECYKEEVPGEYVSQKSGVYFISDKNEDILYIGKATKDNLGAEIWGKFRAPKTENGKLIFKNSALAKWAPKDGEHNYQKIIQQGDIYIHAAIIEPKEFSSLVEVYLQIYFNQKEGKLPPCNNRIG